MRHFSALYRALDRSTSRRAKQTSLLSWLAEAAREGIDEPSAAWTLYLLSGGKPQLKLSSRDLRQMILEWTGLPDWLVAQSHQEVGDLAETLALLAPPCREPVEQSITQWLEAVASLRCLPPAERVPALRRIAEQVPDEQRFVFFKLLTGALRVGVSRLELVRALATHSSLDEKLLAQRMIGFESRSRTPLAEDFKRLLAPSSDREHDEGLEAGRPLPFFLAQPLPASYDTPDIRLGAPADWQIEWKFDGIRAQYVRGLSPAGAALETPWWLWSRGEELISAQFPELARIAPHLPPATIIDGELMIVNGQAAAVAGDGASMDLRSLQSFASLQRRLGRERVPTALIEEVPAALVAYDLLRLDAVDLRGEPLRERRARLAALVRSARELAARAAVPLPLYLSPLLHEDNWPKVDARRLAARSHGTEGLMLKHQLSSYGIGRRQPEDGRGWWKWKLDPLTLDGVLIYAQKGHGRRSGVFSDYTFAVWDRSGSEPALVPFAKAYSGLTDQEMREVDEKIRRTSNESFGPVRAVRPTMVFEIGFEGIAPSRRHRSGVALRFPRILRWRRDKPVDEADTLASLRALLEQVAAGGAVSLHE
jgi:DNA ligase-1